MKPSKYQQEIFKTYNKTNYNVVIDACPGSGKTSTLLELVKFVKPYKKLRVFAFNVSIAEHLSNKIYSPNITVSTIHSYGMSALLKHMDCFVSESKIFNIAKEAFKNSNLRVKNTNGYLYQLCELNNLYRLFYSKNTLNSLSELNILYGLGLKQEDLENALILNKKVQEYNEEITTSKKMIDFIDMLYLPVLWDLKTTQFDEIMVDECQDLSILQYTLVNKALKPGGKGIYVGDERQSIYSFMGANHESFNKIKNQPNTTMLPLYICYRCGSKISQFANQIYPVIESPEWQHEGAVRWGNLDELQYDDMVLCRNNQPLTELYMELISQNKKAFLKDKEFGKKLIKFTGRFLGYNKKESYEKMEESLMSIYEELVKKGISKPTEHDSYLKLKEKINIIKLIGQNCYTIEQIEDKLKQIFIENEEQGIMLSTIHGAKGLESNRTLLLRWDLLPSKFATQDWEKVQEKNLQFVAVTRPKQELIFLKN